MKADKRLERAESVALQVLLYINSKTACRGFDSFCPCHPKVETAWFRLFFGTFWAACFEQTAGDAILTLKSSHPLLTIPPRFVRCSIKKASRCACIEFRLREISRHYQQLEQMILKLIVQYATSEANKEPQKKSKHSELTSRH